jgi:hypothetical protein
MIIGEAQGDTRADLVEPTRHQPVVDLDARDVIDELARRDHPADAPGDHALLQRRRADGDGPIAHPGKRRRMPDRPPVKQHALESGPVQQPQVPPAADRGNRLPLAVARHPPGGKRRVVQEDHARALRDRGRQRIQIESPSLVADLERDEPRHCPDQPHPVEHARVGRVGEENLVPGIGQTEQGVQHRIALAASDHDLPAPVVARPSATLDVGGHGLLEVVAAGERQPAVRLVLADRRPGRRHCRFGRRDVGVEVFQP